MKNIEVIDKHFIVTTEDIEGYIIEDCGELCEKKEELKDYKGQLKGYKIVLPKYNVSGVRLYLCDLYPNRAQHITNSFESLNRMKTQLCFLLDDYSYFTEYFLDLVNGDVTEFMKFRNTEEDELYSKDEEIEEDFEEVEEIEELEDDGNSKYLNDVLDKMNKLQIENQDLKLKLKSAKINSSESDLSEIKEELNKVKEERDTLQTSLNKLKEKISLLTSEKEELNEMYKELKLNNDNTEIEEIMSDEDIYSLFGLIANCTSEDIKSAVITTAESFIERQEVNELTKFGLYIVESLSKNGVIRNA